MMTMTMMTMTITIKMSSVTQKLTFTILHHLGLLQPVLIALLVRFRHLVDLELVPQLLLHVLVGLLLVVVGVRLHRLPQPGGEQDVSTESTNL